MRSRGSGVNTAGTVEASDPCEESPGGGGERGEGHGSGSPKGGPATASVIAASSQGRAATSMGEGYRGSLPHRLALQGHGLEPEW